MGYFSNQFSGEEKLNEFLIFFWTATQAEIFDRPSPANLADLASVRQEIQSRMMNETWTSIRDITWGMRHDGPNTKHTEYEAFDKFLSQNFYRNWKFDLHFWFWTSFSTKICLNEKFA